jgi:hypothetical protein
MRWRALFSFPDPVNELAARCVAAGVVVMAIGALAADVPWMLVPLVYGFWARLLTGPTLSPLGQLATRVLVPALHRRPRPTPGPPKRFAQGIGAVVTCTALVLWLTAGWPYARWLVVLIAVAAALESVLGFCVGCQIFRLAMRTGLVPDRVCEECANIWRRPHEVVTPTH